MTDEIIRGAKGPSGPPAAQDVQFTAGNGFASGEVFNSVASRPLTLASAYLHTDSGVAQGQTLALTQLRAGSVIAASMIAVPTGANDIAVALSPGLSLLAGDVLRLTMPNPADIQLRDIVLALASNP